VRRRERTEGEGERGEGVFPFFFVVILLLLVFSPFFFPFRFHRVSVLSFFFAPVSSPRFSSF